MGRIVRDALKGDLVNVAIRPLAAYEDHGIGSPITCEGLIDTGASLTAIRPRVARKAGLIAHDEVDVQRVGSTVAAPLYVARFKFGHLSNPGDWHQVDLVGAEPADPDADLLIGRNMLRFATLVYDGWEDRIVLLF